MIGKTISHYRIIEKLGGGGMGVVYKAQDLKLDRFVALKFLPPHLGADEEEKKRFSHEAKAASALDHPNICNIHEIDETEDGQIFICMAYYEGETLKKKVDSGQLSVDSAIDIAIQIAQGLAKAHEHGITHRDLKPANVMITKEGVAKIVDFGLAKLAGMTRRTKTGMTVGTAAYMSPEQARGEEVDARTDIWSLGVVMYEMLTGRLPFRAEYEAALVYSVLNEEPEPITSLRTGVPMELERIVNKTLMKKPEERYQHVDEMLVDLKKLQENLKLGMKKAPPQKRQNFFAPSGRRFWISIIALAIILLSILLAYKLEFRVKEMEARAVENLVAVMYFENLVDPEDSQREAQMISNLMITDLSESDYMRVVSDQRLYDILKEMGRENQKLIDKSVATQVAHRARAAKMLMGQISKLGEKIILTSQLLDVGSGEILESQRVDGTDMFSMVDSLTKLIKADLALPAGVLAEGDRSVAEITTRSPEAYRYYLQGLDYYYRYNWDAAEQSFRNAVALDSTFALAYWRLGWMQFRFGWGDMAAAATTSAKAYALKARVAEKERYYIELLYRAFRTSIDESLVPLQQLVEKYPEEKEAWWIMAAGTGGPLWNPLKAISYHEKWLKLDPSFKAGYPWIIRDYLNLGLFEEGKKYALKYLEIAPDDAAAHHHIGYVYFFQDMPELALDEFRRALQLESNYYDAVIGISQTLALQGKFAESDEKLNPLLAEQFAPSHRIGAYYQLSWNALALGKYKQAVNDLKKMIHIMENYHVDVMLPFGHNALGLVYYLSSNFSAAKGEFEYVVANPDITRHRLGYGTSYYLLGIVAVQENRYADALKMAGKIQQIAEGENNSTFKEWYEDLMAQIEFGQNPKYAASHKVKGLHLREYWPWMTDESLPREWWLAQIFERREQMETAIQYYEELVKQKYPWRVNVLYPKSLYRLAKLCELQGQLDRAIAYYQQFLNIWQHADEDIPEKIDAKQRLTALHARSKN